MQRLISSTRTLASPIRLGFQPLTIAAALLVACGGDDAAESTPSGGGIASLSDTGTATGSETDVADDSGGSAKLDAAGGSATAGGGDCPGGNGMPGDLEFSNIWIANTPDGTVSKIDTNAGQRSENIRFLLSA